MSQNRYSVQTEVLNMRSGPGKEYRKIGTLQKGEVVKVTQKQNNWCKVNNSTKTGWVSYSYLKALPINKQTRRQTREPGFMVSGPGNFLPVPAVFDRYVLDLSDYSFGVDQRILSYILVGFSLFLGILVLGSFVYPGTIIYDILMLINSILVIFYFLAMPNPFWFSPTLAWYQIILSFIILIIVGIIQIFLAFCYLQEFNNGDDYTMSPIFWFFSCVIGVLTAFYTTQKWLFLGVALLAITIIYYAIKIFKKNGLKSGLYFLILYLLTSCAFTINALILSVPVIILIIGYLIIVSKSAMAGGGGSSESSNYEEKETITTRDENGHERTLEDTGWGGYKDDKGDEWESGTFGGITRKEK